MKMNPFIWSLVAVFFCSTWGPVLVAAKDAILPQGDPRLQQSEAADQDRREEIRSNRLKQQGQGENYRVEGKSQGGSKGPKVDDTRGHDRRSTGLEDPSVNPGQASGLKTVRGQVLKAEKDSLTIEQLNGEKTVLTVDPQTQFNTNIQAGDRVAGTVTNQGRAVLVQKEAQP